MISESGIKAVAARLSARASSLSMRSSSLRMSFPAASSLPATIRASRVIVPLLLAETAAFALAAASGKIPVFLMTAVRALLTF
jgi:hypothetical protein